MAKVHLALGTNLGDRKANLKEALVHISREMEIEKVSSIYETDPVGYTEQPLFLNIVLKGSTRLKPGELLRCAKEIETRMGRIPSFTNAPRIIDIDILFYDNKIINKPDLIIPHPRIPVRSFVLVPLNEIDPDFIHPSNKRAIKHLIKDLGEIKGLHLWGEAKEIWQRSKNVSGLS